MPNDGKTIYKTCREAAGLTQERAAELLNCGVRTLARWEGGECLPPEDIVYHMTLLYNSQYLAVEHLRQASQIAADILPAVENCNLQTATIRLVNRVLRFASEHRDQQLLQIAEDGKIDEQEQAMFNEITGELRAIVEASTEVCLAKERHYGE